jgi:hypothetical protein
MDDGIFDFQFLHVETFLRRRCTAYPSLARFWRAVKLRYRHAFLRLFSPSLHATVAIFTWTVDVSADEPASPGL